MGGVIVGSINITQQERGVMNIKLDEDCVTRFLAELGHAFYAGANVKSVDRYGKQNSSKQTTQKT